MLVALHPPMMSDKRTTDSLRSTGECPHSLRLLCSCQSLAETPVDLTQPSKLPDC